MPVLSPEFLLRVLQPAFVLALLPSGATLVSCLQLDVITRSRHSPNRTIIGIGFGNIIAGMIGGLPGAISVSSFPNTYSGGRSQIAGLVAALFLLLVVITMRPLASEIPLAVISSIIIINGWNIIDWRFISCIHRVNRGHALGPVDKLLAVAYQPTILGRPASVLLRADVLDRQFVNRP